MPAVRRDAIKCAGSRRTKFLVFAAASASRFPFASYFKDGVEKFERTIKKPTNLFLKNISTQSDELLTILPTLNHRDFWKLVSTFKAGEWMVDLFCLIPIHIAMATDSRFIPLNDGIWLPEAEKALLGATIN